MAPKILPKSVLKRAYSSSLGFREDVLTEMLAVVGPAQVVQPAGAGLLLRDSGASLTYYDTSGMG